MVSAGWCGQRPQTVVGIPQGGGPRPIGGQPDVGAAAVAGDPGGDVPEPVAQRRRPGGAGSTCTLLACGMRRVHTAGTRLVQLQLGQLQSARLHLVADDAPELTSTDRVAIDGYLRALVLTGRLHPPSAMTTMLGEWWGRGSLPTELVDYPRRTSRSASPSRSLHACIAGRDAKGAGGCWHG